MTGELEAMLTDYLKASVEKDVMKCKGLERKISARTDLDPEIKKSIEEKTEYRDKYAKKLHRIDNFRLSREGDVPFREISLACGEKIKIYTITDPNILSRYVGYGKYINRYGYNVYMRGQTDIYKGTLIPSIFRSVSAGSGGTANPDKLVENLSVIMKKISNESKSMNDYNPIVLEPVLQHYGMKTSMIDLVDNLWVALWFGLYSGKTEIVGDKGGNGGTEHLYYAPREPERWEEVDPGKGLFPVRQYAYVYLIATDAIEESRIYGREKSEDKYAGIYEGETTIAVDLRKAVQSRFLRPHAQHGIMLKKKGKVGGKHCAMDYSDLIVGIAEVPVDLGMKWIGQSSLLNVSTLFPSAVYDSGYRDMLNAVKECDLKQNVRQYGSIQVVNGV